MNSRNLYYKITHTCTPKCRSKYVAVPVLVPAKIIYNLYARTSHCFKKIMVYIHSYWWRKISKKKIKKTSPNTICLSILLYVKLYSFFSFFFFLVLGNLDPIKTSIYLGYPKCMHIFSFKKKMSSHRGAVVNESN